MTFYFKQGKQHHYKVQSDIHPKASLRVPHYQTHK